jgi:hypothetical protein
MQVETLSYSLIENFSNFLLVDVRRLSSKCNLIAGHSFTEVLHHDDTEISFLSQKTYYFFICYYDLPLSEYGHVAIQPTVVVST